MVVILIRAVEEPPVSPLPLSTDSGSGSSIHKSSASTSTSGSRFNCYILNDKLKNNNHLRAFTTSSNSYSSSCSQADGDVIATTKEGKNFFNLSLHKNLNFIIFYVIK
jgi:hypothetical protein